MEVSSTKALWSVTCRVAVSVASDSTFFVKSHLLLTARFGSWTTSLGMKGPIGRTSVKLSDRTKGAAREAMKKAAAKLEAQLDTLSFDRKIMEALMRH